LTRYSCIYHYETPESKIVFLPSFHFQLFTDGKVNYKARSGFIIIEDSLRFPFLTVPGKQGKDCVATMVDRKRKFLLLGKAEKNCVTMVG